MGEDGDLQREILTLPHSLYMKIDDGDDVVNCVCEGTPVPCRKSINLPPVKSTQSTLHIYQANNLLTKLSLPEVTESQNSEFKATFIITIEGSIDVTIEDIITNSTTSVTIPCHGESEE